MLKIAKFGGSSLANAQQFRKVRDIVRADESRRVIVVSAPGKRFSGDHKITDLLYLAHAHAKYGVSGESILQMIRDRYAEIAQELNLAADLDAEFARIQSRIRANMLPDELVSRGEYLCAKLMAEVLGYDFLDAADWLRFRYDGTIDAEASGEALRAFFADHPRIVTPGFYGSMPDGKTRLMARGGSDITGALAAALLDADLYENWTDVPGVLMADPRVVDDPKPIDRITYAELRELSYMGAEVLNEESIFPVREKDIPLNIRCTNDPAAPGTMISNFFDDAPEADPRFIPASPAARTTPSSPCTRAGSPGRAARCAGCWRSSSAATWWWSTFPRASTASRWWSPARRWSRCSTRFWTRSARASRRSPSRSPRASRSSPPSAA